MFETSVLLLWSKDTFECHHPPEGLAKASQHFWKVQVSSNRMVIEIKSETLTWAKV